VQDDVHDRWLDIYLAENPPRRPWPWSSADAEFGFLTPRPWRRDEPLELGSPGPRFELGAAQTNHDRE
jgi:hypothetical protein